MADEKMLTSDEAEKLLKEWADYLELDTERSLYAELVEGLRMPVRKQRLTFDLESETFRYQLIKPVDGHQIVEIKEATFQQKQIIERYKDSESIQSAQAVLSRYTDLSPAQVGMLKDRDAQKINMVVMGFLAQTEPSAKR
jgi:hypothetical protein